MRLHKIIEESIEAAVCLPCFAVAIDVLWQVAGPAAWLL
jgi:hypothetical protein